MLQKNLLLTLGADLRALRKARGLTLSELAQALDRSVGWLSQVERDKSEPSISDLKQIARVLDISVSSLFRQKATPSREQGYIVRSDARRPIGSREAGLVEELLSPDLTDDFEVVHSVFEAGSSIEEPNARPTRDVVNVARSRLRCQSYAKRLRFATVASVGAPVAINGPQRARPGHH